MNVLSWLNQIETSRTTRPPDVSLPLPSTSRRTAIACVDDDALMETFASLVSARDGIIPIEILDLEFAPRHEFSTARAMATTLHRWVEYCAPANDPRDWRPFLHTAWNEVYRKLLLGLGARPQMREGRESFVADNREADSALLSYKDAWGSFLERLTQEINRKIPCRLLTIGIRNVHLAPDPAETLQSVLSLGHPNLAVVMSGVGDIKRTNERIIRLMDKIGCR